MDISNKIRSQILIDALPHIQKYHDKIVVVKYGGNAMTNAELKEAVMSDIVLLSEVGIKVVLVHGGGPEINAMLKRVGIESKFINGLRYTDAETIDIVKMVLCGKVNKELVCALYALNFSNCPEIALDMDIYLRNSCSMVAPNFLLHSSHSSLVK